MDCRRNVETSPSAETLQASMWNESLQHPQRTPSSQDPLAKQGGWRRWSAAGVVVAVPRGGEEVRRERGEQENLSLTFNE